ncbi:MAG: 2OG-Fe(II) oxygenase family protein [Pseudomonadota bacterium]
MSLPQSRTLDFSEVPVIDIAPLQKLTGADKTIKQIEAACRDVGFFYVKNHSVSKQSLENLCIESERFFALPTHDKLRTKIDSKMRGYLPLDYKSYEGEENAATNRQEGFWIGHECERSGDDPLAGSNQWPDDRPNLKPAMTRYFVETEQLADTLMRAFALALQLPENYFVKRFDNPNSRLKINHYPPQENPRDQYNIGVLPHTDSGGFTILWQDESGGLEIQNKSGEWVGAPPIEDTFVINLGQTMQIWTNGYFAATPHRVVNRSGGDRYSIPLFVNPNSDALIEPVVGETDNDFAPYRYGEYQRDSWRRAFPVAGIL